MELESPEEETINFWVKGEGPETNVVELSYLEEEEIEGKSSESVEVGDHEVLGILQESGALWTLGVWPLVMADKELLSFR